jgi:hypothetical protein
VKTHLLCTFAHKSDLNIILEYIQSTFVLTDQRIFIFSNKDAPNELFCTYNTTLADIKAQNTIMIHRKKETNTIYTVNALNEIIRTVNNGVLDKTYQLDWTCYQNSFILSTTNDLRIIPLNLYKKINI